MRSDYHSTPLAVPEYTFLIDLERRLGMVIPKIAIINDTTFGFTIEKEHVIGLGLSNQGLASFPETIGNLISLKKIILWKNWLITLPESVG